MFAVLVAILTKAGDLGIGEGYDQPLANVQNFEAEVGKGVKCEVDNVSVHIGNRRCLAANEILVTPGTFDALEFITCSGNHEYHKKVDH